MTWVQPVVVFWNPFAAGLVNGDGVIYLHGTRLTGWLEEQSPKIAPDMVSRVAAAIARRDRARSRLGGNDWRRSTFGAGHSRRVTLARNGHLRPGRRTRRRGSRCCF